MNYDGYTKYDRKVAQDYDQDRQDEAHWREEYDWLASYAARQRLGRVLDIPVGTGRLLPALSSAEAIVGVDVSEDMLEVARRAVASTGMAQVELRKGDALRLQDQDGSFDTISCFRLAHLLPPELIEPLIQELSRVCAGTIVLQVYLVPERITRWPPFAWLLRQARRLRARKQLPWSHIKSYPHTWRLFERAFVRAGLTVRARHCLGRYGSSTVEVVELAR